MCPDHTCRGATGLWCRVQSEPNQLGTTRDCAMLADTSQDVTVSPRQGEWVEIMMFFIAYVSI